MARESYVFIQLPGETTATVAGLFTYEDSITPEVGTFVYGKSFLANTKAVPLDPVALPLREVEFRTTLTGGIFGVLRDALPDDWGKHLVNKLHGDRYGTPFDLLLLPSADRFGALSFGANSKSPYEEPEIARLDSLTDQVLDSLEKIDRDLAITEVEKRVAIAFGGGTHAGGARPKLTLQDGNRIWLAKLNRYDDDVNNARVEAAMLDLATTCGILVPEHRVVKVADKDVLLIERFDRRLSPGGILKFRTASAASVFRADEEYAPDNFTGSYMRLSRELARWGVDVSNDRKELYRRMAFNCLAGIVDDHERNHALVAERNHFRLAPAFDLSPSRPTTRRRMQSLSIGEDGGESTRRNLLSAAEVFELAENEADEVIDTIKERVTAKWRDTFQLREVNEHDIELLSRCFDHDYFESDPKVRAMGMRDEVFMKR